MKKRREKKGGGRAERREGVALREREKERQECVSDEDVWLAGWLSGCRECPVQGWMREGAGKVSVLPQLL